MNEFLKIEYEKCLDLLQYYDDRHQSFVKFASGLSSGVPSLLLATYQLGHSDQFFWQFTVLISIVTTLGLLSIYTVLVQLRLYFIYPVRQVNALRAYFLVNDAEEFSNNQMYLDTNFKAFKWASSHTLLNGFVALQIGAFTGLSVFAIAIINPITNCRVLLSASVGIVVAVLCFGLSGWYLHAKGKFHPDKSIHGKEVK